MDTMDEIEVRRHRCQARTRLSGGSPGGALRWYRRMVLIGSGVALSHPRRWRRLARRLTDELLGELDGVSKGAAALAQYQRKHIAAGAHLVVVPHPGLGPAITTESEPFRPNRSSRLPDIERFGSPRRATASSAARAARPARTNVMSTRDPVISANHPSRSSRLSPRGPRAGNRSLERSDTSDPLSGVSGVSGALLLAGLPRPLRDTLLNSYQEMNSSITRSIAACSSGWSD
jgi:hypothetical protein